MPVDLPIAVSCSIEVMGTLLAGEDIESFYVSLAHRDLLWGSGSTAPPVPTS